MIQDLSSWTIVIPARLKSSRLIHKPLQLISGKHLVVWMFENMLPLRDLGAKLFVAVDSLEVRNVCKERSIDFIETDPELPSGTDRVAFVAKDENRPFVMNIQGDELFLDVKDVIALAKAFQCRKDRMGTLVYKSSDSNKFINPNTVKAVLDDQGYVSYFSRSPIPFHRDVSFKYFWQHLGIYAFTRNSIMEFCNLQTRSIENTEKLEQLRAIESGWKIWSCEAKVESWGIDTPEDLKRAQQIMDERR